MSKDWIVILVITFIALIIWLAADIYHTKASVAITPKLQQALTPLNPNFDQTTLKEIEKIEQPDIQTTPNNAPAGPGEVPPAP